MKLSGYKQVDVVALPFKIQMFACDSSVTTAVVKTASDEKQRSSCLAASQELSCNGAIKRTHIGGAGEWPSKQGRCIRVCIQALVFSCIGCVVYRKDSCELPSRCCTYPLYCGPPCPSHDVLAMLDFGFAQSHIRRAESGTTLMRRI